MSDWHHSPIHRFGDANTFFITGATYLKQHFYRSARALDSLRSLLFAKANETHCWLQAWALLSNHYHLVVRCEMGESVRTMISRFHTEAALEANRRDGIKERRVWFQYWDKTLTFESSWLARLKYTHENAVHHRLVRDARDYPWCSAAWFEKSAPSQFVETVARIKTDRLKIYDPFPAVALPPHS